jgi:uncharacterized protein (DUF4415 family)
MKAEGRSFRDGFFNVFGITRRCPPKKNITLRIDPEIIEWFRAKGKGYQTRMNAVLRAYVEFHRKGHRKAS